MKRLLLLFLCLALTGIGWAQSPGFGWATVTEGPGAHTTEQTGIAVDSAGNVFHVGSFRDEVDFNPDTGVFLLDAGPTNYQDIFVRKLDAAGNFLWAFKLGKASNQEDALAAVCDPSGNLYVVGAFDDLVDFDPGTGIHNLGANTSNRNAFLLKIDPNGNYIWATELRGSGVAGALAVTVSAAGDVYWSGYSTGGTMVLPIPGGTVTRNSAGDTDGFIVKTSAAGVNQWIAEMGGPGYDIVMDIVTNAAGDVFATGSFENSCDFNPNGTALRSAKGMSDAFVWKIKNDGTFHWVKAFKGLQVVEGFAIDLDAAGNIYCAGMYNFHVDFDPSSSGTHTMTTAGSADTYIVKLSPTGSLVWAEKTSSSDWIVMTDLVVTPNGYVFTTGRFDGVCDFAPGAPDFTISAGGFSWLQYLQQLDTDGQFVWAAPLIRGGDPRVEKMIADDASNLYFCGACGTEADYDLGPDTVTFYPAIGGTEFFALMLTHCSASSGAVAVTRYGSYTSPSGNFVWNSSGVYLDTLVNSTGCDSLLTINLTVLTSCITPGNLIATSIQDTSALLTWDTVPGAFAYKVEWKVAGTSTWNTGFKNSQQGQYAVDGLQPGTAYRFRIRGNCPDGWGVWSIQERFVTLTTACEIPGNLSTTAISSTKARLSWAVPTNVYTLQIRWREISASNWVYVSKSATKDRHWLTTLQGGTSYEWQIRTICRKGNTATSKWSSSQAFTTPSAKMETLANADAQPASSVSIYPNPNNGSFEIAVSGNELWEEVVVTDLAGRTVYRSNIAGDSRLIKLANTELSPGLYFVNLKAGNSTHTSRVVIAHN